MYRQTFNAHFIQSAFAQLYSVFLSAAKSMYFAVLKENYVCRLAQNQNVLVCFADCRD